ncbi:MAG: hypothetical protein GTO41_25560, partial [Burkholderiales bacterium]|nr:hypothetical protein [Burkholderiales bacterium]
YRVLELSAAIPHTLKVKNGHTKYLLKKVAERYVPKEVIYRKKQGFSVPVAKWFRGDLSAL